jgi:hypothetical protein
MLKIMSKKPGQRTENAGGVAQKEDRRRSPRQEYAATAWISPESGVIGHDRQVVVVDLSLHGVGFTSERGFEQDAIHWIVIGHGMLRASSRIRVVSCRQNDSGHFDCGAEFF